MLTISFIAYSEFQRVQKAELSKNKKLDLLAEMSRYNTLSAVKKAGSGHLGSSLSALDLFIFLYYSELNIKEVGAKSVARDIFFSSKGHDCPGQYAVLAGFGLIPFEKLLKLRRLGGLDGHPDVKIPGMEANTGSLGMGISKARGMAFAKTFKNNQGRVFVMTGDGEWQEGQIWESLQTTVHQKVHNLCAIVDWNLIQTDKYVSEISSLGDFRQKCEAFGWHVEECDGHNFESLESAFRNLDKIQDKPKILLAKTVKGQGVSFMEGPVSIKNGNGIYQWHSGAPNDQDYIAAVSEIYDRVKARFQDFNLGDVLLEVAETREDNRVKLKDVAEKVVNAYEDALLELGKVRQDLIVLDADLSADCGCRKFEHAFPDRFIENGIAEQDMVSMAGGLALSGCLPVVNSFGTFLSARANEQFFNNATENTKIIYACHYAGLIPAGPGKSHQSLRDIALFGSLPNCTIVEPCNAQETKALLDWCIQEAQGVCMMRLIISPSPKAIVFPENYKLEYGKGTVLHNGKDAILFTYGPVMTHEALTAAELLKEEGFSLKVVTLPWLNRVDVAWVASEIGDIGRIFTLDNHYVVGGLGDHVLQALSKANKLGNKLFTKLGIESFPACGTPQEVLAAHNLDARSLMQRIAHEK